jgi:AcrR family transcriptional regulator
LTERSVPASRPDREARREQIIKAAATVFAAKGFESATITDIIQAACVARRTFYNYFESKKDIFLKLVESYFSGYTEILARGYDNLVLVLEQDPSGTIGAWRDLVLSILQFHSENRELTVLVWREAQAEDEHFTARVQELIGMARGRVLEEFRLMEERGLLVDTDIEMATTIINSAVMTIVLDHVLRKDDLDLKEIADQVVRYQARALAPDRAVVDEEFGTR